MTGRAAGGSLTLYHGPASPFVRKVRIFAAETGLTERLRLVRTPVGMREPSDVVSRANPLGRIPVLINEHGEVFWESDLICEYLDALHGGTPYIPREGAERWRAMRWNALASGALSVLVLWRNEMLRPLVQQDADLIAVWSGKVWHVLSWMESHADELPPGLRFCGIATLCLLGYIDFRFPVLCWRRECPRLSRWEQGLRQWPSVTETLPRSDR